MPLESIIFVSLVVVAFSSYLAVLTVVWVSVELLGRKTPSATEAPPAVEAERTKARAA